MRTLLPLLAFIAFTCTPLVAADQLETKPQGEQFAKFEPVKAPVYTTLYLKQDDRLAIIGDSITEQKMYSRIIETYLTVALSELKITARQYGWSGETAEGFKNRMKQDCLRFQPTIATLCYGMNDHRYKPYDEGVAKWYRDNYGTVAKNLKDAGARVVIGSPGSIGKMPHWVKSATGTVEDLNLNLCALRNIDVGLAKELDVRFADVFWPMYTNFWSAKTRYAQDYEVPGNDGVHPDWAGHLVMAYAYLKALGCDGNVGTITVDLAKNKATASTGHTVTKSDGGEIALTSTRYPFCATGPLDKHNSMRSGMTLMPFMQELNRFTLIATGGSAAKYAVTWGAESRTYTAEQLKTGVNLADDFAVNPFSDAFKQVDEAVIKKQNYKTEQIKKHFHGADGKADIEKTATETEAIRAPLAAAIAATVVPVSHVIKIAPAP
ncbi:MAG TPA: SGNH/GDSL hydrolase family protein [Planctomycetota bacterium]|nr:SGNH/GDSL hydrolase family protein [Planctomycetota bacterium]